MGMGDELNKTVLAWVTLAITIVVGSVVLLKFKDITGVTAELNTTIDTFVTGLSEPKNWVIIVIIGIIGFGVLRLFQRKSQ